MNYCNVTYGQINTTCHVNGNSCLVDDVLVAVKSN